MPPLPSAPEPVSPAFGRHDRAAAHEGDPYLGSGWSRHVPDALPPVPPRTVVAPVVPPSAEPPPADPPRSPLEWPAAPSLLGPPTPPRLEGAPRRRRTDDTLEPPVPGEFVPTTQHPAVAPSWAAPQPADDGRAPGQDTSDRLAQILAENGVSTSSGGRRRRRYREDGESDDVLARVLGRD
ncbi:conserved protein of unknown function [Blastococcus saxobsidens DD2]|uniref:Uncharacterized protein n=1 Tax=Blastococcus saxobsidens (strain DD2) TaxID=1146883 RepID=H6RPX5_BLASD|nr:conserved protein of unknown function [Blastococcus saxobsidens DD2]